MNSLGHVDFDVNLIKHIYVSVIDSRFGKFSLSQRTKAQFCATAQLRAVKPEVPDMAVVSRITFLTVKTFC
jgi:hypothetical protein